MSSVDDGHEAVAVLDDGVEEGAFRVGGEKGVKHVSGHVAVEVDGPVPEFDLELPLGRVIADGSNACGVDLMAVHEALLCHVRDLGLCGTGEMDQSAPSVRRTRGTGQGPR